MPGPKDLSRKAVKPKSATLIIPKDPINAPAPKDDKQLLTVGVVARGHVVKFGPGKGRKNYAHPGETVGLPKDEIERLRAKGTLVDPGRIIVPLGTGPQFFREDAASKGVSEASE